MTKDEFLDKWRDILAGKIIEGMVAEYRGAQLGVWTRTVHKRVDEMLQQMHADLIPSQPPVTKGKA